MSAERNAIIKKGTKKNNFPLAVMFGFVCGILMMLLFSIIFSFLALKIKNPINFSGLLSLICVSIGGAFCGLASSIYYKTNPILSSTSSLLILCLLMFLSAFTKNNGSWINLIISPLICFGFGIFSSIIAGGTFKKKKIKKYLK